MLVCKYTVVTENKNFESVTTLTLRMRFLKEYEIRLNVSPKNMFDGSMKNDNLVSLLSNMFENKCVNGSFITGVRSIKDRSMITIDKSDLGGGGGVHIRFCAEAIEYQAGAALVGCEVMNVERDGMITCRYEHAIVHIKGNRNFAPTKGDLIIAKVLEVGYPLESTNMSIAACPFSIPLKAHLKLINPAQLGDVEVELLSRKMLELEEIKKNYKSVDKTVAKFFEDLFYPMKTPETYYSVNEKRNVVSLKTGYESYDIEKLIEAAISSSAPFKLGTPMVLLRHAAIPKQTSSVLVLGVDKVRSMKDTKDPMIDPKLFETRVIASPFTATLLEILADYSDFLSTIIQCSIVYSTEAVRKNNARLWSVYKQIKA
jgi:hypothetical protein